jgi:hypothetical protein
VARGAALIANLNELQRALLRGGYVDPVLARSLGYDTCEFDKVDKLPDPKPVCCQNHFWFGILTWKYVMSSSGRT